MRIWLCYNFKLIVLYLGGTKTHYKVDNNNQISRRVKSCSSNSLHFVLLYYSHKPWVNFQKQGQIWNLLVLTFSKHPLHLQFDQVLAEKFEVKDTWYHFFIFMIIDFTERKTIEIWRFCFKINWLNILKLLMVFLRIILVDIGTFDGEQNHFWNKLFRFLLFSSPTNQISRK